MISSNLFATHNDMDVFWMKANYGNHVVSLRRWEPIAKIFQIKYELNSSPPGGRFKTLMSS